VAGTRLSSLVVLVYRPLRGETNGNPTRAGGVTAASGKTGGTMNGLTRRGFTAAALAGVGTALGAARVLGAGERVRLGFIGLGNRGDQVLDAFLQHKDAEVVALCDIHQPYLDFATKKVGTNPQQFRDYRKLLERNDLNAVVICTP